jgi:hypothetical protein
MAQSPRCLRVRLITAMSNTLSYLNVPQCLESQRCPRLAAHVVHQVQHLATYGYGCTRLANMLRQVPAAGGFGADTRHRRPQGTYSSSPRIHKQRAYASQRPDHSDISLALVPRDHPVIPYASLEAEGHGLLDRLLDIIHGDHRSDRPLGNILTTLTGYSDGLVVTATLNSLGMLIQRRPIAANKILNSVFSFNPLKLANSPMTPKNKVILKSIERTTRALLVNVMKRYVQS